MNLRNYITHAAVGFGLSLPVVPAIAQQQAAADADVPESAGVITPQRDAAPKWKGFAPVPKAAKVAAGQRSDGRLLTSGPTFRSTSLLGMTISDANGQPVGKVVDFVTDAQGNILYPLVSYSGSPGFGGRLFAVPRGSLRFGAGPNNSSMAQLSFDPQLLRNAPSFASSQFSQLSDPAFQNRLNSYYQSSSFPRNAFFRVGGAMNTSGSPAVNPSLPLTGVPSTEATGFNTAGGTFVPNAAVVSGTIPAPATGSIIGSSGSPAGPSSIIGPSGAPGGSTLPAESVIGPSGSPAGTSPSGGNNATSSSLFPPFGSQGSSQLFPQAQPNTIGPSATPNTNGPSAVPNTNGPSATPNATGPSATPNTMGPSATPNVGGGASPAGK
jgi:hypothetical protein